MKSSDLITANSSRWTKAKITRLGFPAIAKRLCAAKSRYQTVSNKTGVPWFVIAVIHEREASQDWNTQLGQGDPLNQVSTHVPKGRGPFKTWEDGAIDALTNCGPYASHWKDWSAGGALTLLEMYNGLGYANRGLPSPYVWSGTDQYSSGKYVSDGVFDPNKIDEQYGCAGMIMAMMAIDKSISFSAPQIQIPAKHVAAGGAVAGGVIAAQQAHQSGQPLRIVFAILLGSLMIAAILYILLHKKGN